MKDFINKNQEKAYYSSPVLLQAMMLFFLAAGIYINTIGFDYTLNDHLVITENDFTKQGVKGVYDIFTNNAMDGYSASNQIDIPEIHYRPLAMTMFAMEYELWGEDPLAGHLINILLFALTAVMLFYLLRHVFKFYYQKPWYLTLPLLAVAFYVVHPLHTGVVANIKGREQILLMLGMAATLYFVIRFADTKKTVFLFISAISFLLTLFSHENAITLLIIAPLMIWVFRDELPKRILFIFLPLLFVLIVYMIVRKSALGLWVYNPLAQDILQNPYMDASASEKYATIFYTMIIYLKLLVFPQPLTHDYHPLHIEITDFSNPWVIVSLIIWSMALIFSLIRIWKKDVIAFCILFFVVTFIGYSNILFNSGRMMSESFMFVPSLAAVIIAAYFFNQTLRRLIRRRLYYKRITIYLVIALLIAASARTIHRNLDWKDNITLYTNDIEISKESIKANISLSKALKNEALRSESHQKHDSLLEKSRFYKKRAMHLKTGK